jgi:hypothetical protein
VPELVPSSTPDVNLDFPDFVVCSSAHNLVKYFEKYIVLMDIIRPAAYDVFEEVIRLVQFYFYSVFHMFTNGYHIQAFFLKIDVTTIKEESLASSIETLHAYHIFQSKHLTLFNQLILAEYKNLRGYLMAIKAFYEKFGLNREEVTPSLVFPTSRPMQAVDITERAVAVESLDFIDFNLREMMKVAKVFGDYLFPNFIDASDGRNVYQSRKHDVRVSGEHPTTQKVRIHLVYFRSFQIRYNLR